VVAPVVIDASPDPQKFLLDLMNDPAADPRMRLEAAKALMPFMHGKPGASGKKEERAQAAKKAGTGKFAPVAAPLRLVK
jgi:phage terminase small subunit